MSFGDGIITDFAFVQTSDPDFEFRARNCRNFILLNTPHQIILMEHPVTTTSLILVQIMIIMFILIVYVYK